MSHVPFDQALDTLFEKYEKNQGERVENRETALTEEAQFIENFYVVRSRDLRPMLEKMGHKLQARDHDYSLTEGDFQPPHGSRAQADEAFLKMSIFLAHLKDRTRTHFSKIPYISFTTDHRKRKVAVHTSDFTETGGQVVKEGDYDLNQLSPMFVQEKFLQLFTRLIRK
jgi:hypothetical protein